MFANKYNPEKKSVHHNEINFYSRNTLKVISWQNFQLNDNFFFYSFKFLFNTTIVLNSFLYFCCIYHSITSLVGLRIC